MKCLLVIRLIRLVSAAIIPFGGGVGQCVLGAAFRGGDHASLDQMFNSTFTAEVALYSINIISNASVGRGDHLLMVELFPFLQETI